MTDPATAIEAPKVLMLFDMVGRNHSLKTLSIARGAQWG